MRATAILPVKRFGAAKQRLAVGLPERPRAALVRAMLEDVLAAIGRSRMVERVIVVSDEPAAERAALEHGAEVLPDPRDAGHSKAASLGVRRALELGAGCAALLPGDCPLIAPDELDHALDRIGPGRAAIIPDRHGTGTNGLLLSPPDAFPPAFGGESRARHEALARRAGVQATIEALPSLGLDVDTPDDLEALAAVLRRSPEAAPRTAAELRSTVSA